MCDSKIIEKVQKLFLKAEHGATEAEALSFISKAKEIMNRYNLSDEDIFENEEEVGFLLNSDFFNSNWRRCLWQAVGNLFFCEYIAVKRYAKVSRSKRYRECTVHVFIGKRANTIIATNMATYLLNTIIRLANAASKKGGHDAEYTKHFIEGCSFRIIERLNELMEKENSTDYIRIMHDNAAEENQKFMQQNMGETVKNEIILHGSGDAGINDGYETGDTINLDQQIDGTDELIRLAS